MSSIFCSLDTWLGPPLLGPSPSLLDDHLGVAVANAQPICAALNAAAVGDLVDELLLILVCYALVFSN